jgi:hypothetical protein
MLTDSEKGRLGRSRSRGVTGAAEDRAQCFDDAGVVHGGGGGFVVAVGDAAHGLAEDLARAGLGQGGYDRNVLEGGDGADAFADELDEFGLDLARFAVAACFEDDEAARDLPLEFVGDADDGAFGDGERS